MVFDDVAKELIDGRRVLVGGGEAQSRKARRDLKATADETRRRHIGRESDGSGVKGPPGQCDLAVIVPVGSSVQHRGVIDGVNLIHGGSKVGTLSNFGRWRHC